MATLHTIQRPQKSKLSHKKKKLLEERRNLSKLHSSDTNL